MCNQDTAKKKQGMHIPDMEKSDMGALAAWESPAEIALDEYRNVFGRAFPLGYGGRIYQTEDELIKRIKECISTGIPEKSPAYDPNCDY